MRLRQIFRNAVMASGQVLLSGGMLFALYYFLLREIGPSQLGIWSIVLATSSAVRLSELGLSGGVVRFVSKYVARDDALSAAGVVQTAAVSIAVILAAILVLLYPLIGSVLRYFIPPEGHSQGMSLLPFAFASLWFGAVGGIFTSGLDGMFRTDIRSYLMTGGTAIHLALVFLLVPKYGLLGIGYSQVIQSTFVLVASWLMLRREIRSLPVFPYRWNRDLFNEMFRYGLNIQAASVAQMLFDPTTKMLLSKFGGLDSVAFFEMANRMVMQVRGLVVSANQVMVPVFSKITEEDPKEIASAYRKSYGLLFFVAVPLFSGVAALTPVVSVLWVGGYQSLFVTFSMLLTVGWFLNTLCAPSYFSNMGTGHLNWNTISHVSMGALNATLGPILGYLFGSVGVVAGFALALVVGSALVIRNYHARYAIPLASLFTKENAPILLMAILAPAVAWGLYGEWQTQSITMFTATIGYVAIGALFGLVMWVNPLGARLIVLARSEIWKNG